MERKTEMEKMKGVECWGREGGGKRKGKEGASEGRRTGTKEKKC